MLTTVRVAPPLPASQSSHHALRKPRQRIRCADRQRPDPAGRPPAFGAPPGAAALAVDLDRGAGVAHAGKPRHGRGAAAVGLLRAAPPGAHGRGDDAGRGTRAGAGGRRRQPPPGAGAARQRGAGHGAPGLGPAGAGTAAGAAPEPPLRQHRPPPAAAAGEQQPQRAFRSAAGSRDHAARAGMGLPAGGRGTGGDQFLHRGDDALPARGDQTRRHGGGGIADLLRDAAVAGSRWACARWRFPPTR
jgi:hypothetical protein